jgi:hypothetical protein
VGFSTVRPGLVTAKDFTEVVSDGPHAMRQAVRFNVKYGTDLNQGSARLAR